ncbi:conserved protein, unknown function [Plasmodium ovale]|uniref:DUF155 domain-containing protein n=1 Tax=Plasmodium ovale TaxID=36330 RepID=A0A1C3KPN6_PLAOA|nr:conserved protein, unknown function [Plasmodium ovale]
MKKRLGGKIANEELTNSEKKEVYVTYGYEKDGHFVKNDCGRENDENTGDVYYSLKESYEVSLKIESFEKRKRGKKRISIKSEKWNKGENTYPYSDINYVKYLSDTCLTERRRIISSFTKEMYSLDDMNFQQQTDVVVDTESKCNISKDWHDFKKKKRAYKGQSCFIAKGTSPFRTNGTNPYPSPSHSSDHKKVKKECSRNIGKHHYIEEEMHKMESPKGRSRMQENQKKKMKTFQNGTHKIKIKKKKDIYTIHREEDKGKVTLKEPNDTRKNTFRKSFTLELREVNKKGNYKIHGKEKPRRKEGKNLFQVKFLCQAKSYDLMKISSVFLSKNITHHFFDNNNVLCVFLTPDICIKNVYSYEDIYNIDHMSFKKSLTYSNAKYIFFIFKNGSVVIWENFRNNFKSDYFINKVIIFLNSYSDELLPVYILQLDKLSYCQGGDCHEEGDEDHMMLHPTSTTSNGTMSNEEHCNNGTRGERRQGGGNGLVRGGVIRLTNDSLEQKLTVSFALSQSIRLDVHEMLMDTAINTLFSISKEIAAKGKCAVSKKKLSSMLGVYTSIIHVNAVQDFLDIPEYFWDRVRYEHVWFEVRRMHKYMEIPERVKILNKRYNYYKDFLKDIKTEVYNKKTFFTYRIVVLLLFIHVLALILNDFFFAK